MTNNSPEIDALVRAAEEYARNQANYCGTYRGLNHNNCPSSVECSAPSPEAREATYNRKYDQYWEYHYSNQFGR